jgi:hypothetical protein
MKNRKSKRKGTAKSWLLGFYAVLFLGFCVAAGFGARHYFGSRPFVAIGMFACGVPQGYVVIFRDGKQQFFEPGDPRGAKLLEGIPQERRGMLRAQGAMCANSRPQVY